VFSKDFWPYSKINHLVWAGFYTSDSWFKRRVADFSYLNAAFQQATSFALFDFKMSMDTAKATKKANEVMSLMLHHDAITGTHSPSTGVDYDRRIA
jgi:hypothetical protein